MRVFKMKQQAVVIILSLAMCLADMMRKAQAAAANSIIESISNGAIHAVAPAYADFINKPILDLSSEDSRRKINDKDGFRAKANPSQ